MFIIPCTFAYLRYLEKIKDAVSHLRLGNNFPLNCSLAPPHVQRRPHQRQIIFNLYPTLKSKLKLVVWKYFGYRKAERLCVLEDRQFTKTGLKVAAKRGNTSNIGVCDIIVIVVLTMCNLTISSILQKPNKTPTECTHTLAYVVMKRVKQCTFTFRVCSFTA